MAFSLALALALSGGGALMSPGCSSLTGSCILRLDFAASGTPALLGWARRRAGSLLLVIPAPDQVEGRLRR